MQEGLSIPISMKNFLKLLYTVSPDISVCVRGRHAIGKSEGVYQAARQMRSDFYKDEENCRALVKRFGGKVKVPGGYVTEWTYEEGVPVIERRLSQMTEGDIIGLPVIENQRSTQFLPCDWLIDSTEFPVVLFLDERNRAIEGVKQSVFQLTDSKGFYGFKLHDETRIVIAENVGDAYTVNQTDPAEVSRCATVTLDPTLEEWVDYAKTRCHPAIIEYIRSNPKALEHTGTFDPNKKYPDRRSWFNLNNELVKLGYLDDEPTNPMIYFLAGAFCGNAIASSFSSFVKNRDREVSGKDIAKDWQKAKKRLITKESLSNEKYIELSMKVADYLLDKKTKTTDAILMEVSRFMFDCPSEVTLSLWARICETTEIVIGIKEHVSHLLVNINTSRTVDELKYPGTDKTYKEVCEEFEANLKTNMDSSKDNSTPARRGRPKTKSS